MGGIATILFLSLSLSLAFVLLSHKPHLPLLDRQDNQQQTRAPRCCFPPPLTFPRVVLVGDDDLIAVFFLFFES